MSIEEKVIEIIDKALWDALHTFGARGDTVIINAITHALLTSPDIEVVDKATQDRAEKYRAALVRIRNRTEWAETHTGQIIFKEAYLALEEKP